MDIEILFAKPFTALQAGTPPKEVSKWKQLKLQVFENSLVVTHDGRKYLRLPSGTLSVEKSGEDVVISLAQSQKQPLAKVKKANFEELKGMIDFHNKWAKCKEPLAIEFEDENRPSLMTERPGEKTNYEGFMNLVIIFSGLVYGKFVADHIKGYGIYVGDWFAFFFKHVMDYNIYMCMIVQLSYFLFGFFWQKLAFKLRLNEKIVGTIFTIATIVFLFTIIKLFEKYKISLLVNAVVDSFSIALVLKMVSYSHVLYNIRWVLHKIGKLTTQKEKSEFLDLHALPRVF